MLLQLLECRLDNAIFRMGFAQTRPQARQIVSHGFVKVNGRRVNIPSFLVKQGDEINLILTDSKKKFINSNIEATENRVVPSWLAVDQKSYMAKISRLPDREDVAFPINEQLIIELYSK